MMCSIDHVD
jgi:hypothetical protein